MIVNIVSRRRSRDCVISDRNLKILTIFQTHTYIVQYLHRYDDVHDSDYDNDNMPGLMRRYDSRDILTIFKNILGFTFYLYFLSVK